MPKVMGCVKEGPGKVTLAPIEMADPGPGQALIRTTLSTICGSDLHIIDMEMIPAGLPQGHEAVGFIEAIGDGVERFKPGDRVVSSCAPGCGTCERCSHGDLSLCSTYGSPLNVLFGCQSEAYVVNAADHNLAVVPKGMSDKQAIFAADIMSTGFGAIERAQLKEGETVAVFAQGPVGLCVTAAAKFYGAGRIITVESVPERVAMSVKLGADDVVSPEGAADRIMELTGGRGVDLAVEALGKQETFDNCLKVVRLGGSVCSVGVYSGVESLSIPIGGTFMDRNIMMVYCPCGTKRLLYLMGLMESGKVDLTPMFTHDMKLDSIVDAYDLFRDRRDGVLKIAITP